MLKRRFFTAFLAALTTVPMASAQVVTPQPPVLAPPARDIAPMAPSPSYAPVIAPAAPPEIVYEAPASAGEDVSYDSESTSVLPSDVPAYSDLCRAAPKPPWCEDKPASPRTP